MNKAFTLWTQAVRQIIATDGIWNYGITGMTVQWSQPKWGGQMTIYHRDGDQEGCAWHEMGRRDA